jgi:hypothetical protein
MTIDRNALPLPRILAVGEEPPPMEPTPAPSSNGRHRARAKGSPDDGKPGDDRRRTGDRFSSINAFLDATMAGLRPAERSVWLLLWRDTRPDGLARTSQADLARRAGVSVRAVRAALRELEHLRLVVVVRRGRLQTGPSSYRVRALADCD